MTQKKLARSTVVINESEADYVLRHSVKILKNVVNISVTKSNRTPRWVWPMIGVANRPYPVQSPVLKGKRRWNHRGSAVRTSGFLMVASLRHGNTQERPLGFWSRPGSRRGGGRTMLAGEEGRLKKRARSVLRISSRYRPKMPKTVNNTATWRFIWFKIGIKLKIFQRLDEI